MKIRNYLLGALLPVVLYSCGNGVSVNEKKALQQHVHGAYPTVTLEFDGENPILTGTVFDDTSRQNLLKEIKAIKGLGTIEDNLTVQAFVSPNAGLMDTVRTVLKDYPTINAIVADSTVILTGSLTKDSLEPLKNKLLALKPKEVVTKNIVLK